ncbi:phosphonate C-P lyase system protein PhnH [Affinibrenneria salicis]|uniref:Phosphonate C-P lyase system protein PhnH n=1 Tax=Affinibrenneria salicis TaxID=2590031 RepID=A0A5J5FY22_9GAMM|nr:phosphonate C-P lyase system protein PhnH [Affinibrenneria salicis]KAA8999016.1 phosphonate C-P lyase system protein PhnH [Affinibrenneria salicis]
MTLLTGFSDPVSGAQRAFRQILKAMSEPGTQVELIDGPVWPFLSPAMCAALLTLVDHDTPLYLAAPFAGEQLKENLRFHTGAPLVDRAARAAFALLDRDFPAVLLDEFAVGSGECPHRSATLIVDVPALTGAPPLTLRGPGIESRRQTAAALSPAVRDYLCRRPVSFPLGLDFIFTCGRQLLAIPRTTHVEVD